MPTRRLRLRQERVFVASAAAIPARRRHASSPVPSSPKTLNRGPFEVHVAYAVRFVLPPFPPPPFLELNPSSSLALSLFLSPLFRTPLCNPASDPQVPLPRFRTRGAHLPRQFPGSIKSRNSRFPPRRSVVSLPVGRYYPGASRKFIVHGEKERKRKREGGGTSAGKAAGSRAHAHIYIHTDEDRVACATKHL